MFIESRLLDCVAYGTQGGPSWSTRRVPLKSGITRRNAQRSRPQYRFAVIYRNLDAGDHEQVIAAFNACMGGLHSFRIKDWSDFEAAEQQMSALGTGSEQILQLRKLYTFGTQTVARPIRKPVTGTVTMTANGSPLAASVNYTTGMVTYTAPSASVVRWSGELDVPVYFEDDYLPFSADNRGADGLILTSDVSLLEDLDA